jgi:hypothetical protein
MLLCENFLGKHCFVNISLAGASFSGGCRCMHADTLLLRKRGTVNHCLVYHIIFWHIQHADWFILLLTTQPRNATQPDWFSFKQCINHTCCCVHSILYSELLIFLVFLSFLCSVFCFMLCCLPVVFISMILLLLFHSCCSVHVMLLRFQCCIVYLLVFLVVVSSCTTVHYTSWCFLLLFHGVGIPCAAH